MTDPSVLESIRPELLVLIPVLWVLGKLCKEAPFVPDHWIPVLLGIVSTVLSVCYVAGSCAAFDGTTAFTAVTQGILCAGTAVYGNQLIRQAGKKEDADER